MDTATLLDALGGNTAVARLLAIRQPSVSEWRARDFIPKDKLILLAVIAEDRGLSTRQKLMPHDFWRIWPDLAHLKPADAA
ncbi:MAG: helix-turn-helix domain-containing protein [Rhodospirillales bacterium]|nr:helix-turn-helix domain-containing protein [Rhodospirillales bacterium]